VIIPEINSKKVYALIVGIEKYQEGQHYNLNGPASDAIKFANWLLERGVEKDNIWLFISSLTELSIPPTLCVRSANREEIINVIDYNLLQNGKGGDLLYIFWGGHGYLTTSATTTRRLMYEDK
jgi:Caspase domain